MTNTDQIETPDIDFCLIRGCDCLIHGWSRLPLP